MLPEPVECPGSERPNPRGRQAQDLADVLVRQLVLVPKEDDVALACRKSPTEGVEPQPELGNAGGEVGSSQVPASVACLPSQSTLGRIVSGNGSQAINRRRRHRSVAIRRAITRSHGSGRPAGPWPERQAANARVNVSATISSTSSRPPVVKITLPRNVAVVRLVDGLE